MDISRDAPYFGFEISKMHHAGNILCLARRTDGYNRRASENYVIVTGRFENLTIIGCTRF